MLGEGQEPGLPTATPALMSRAGQQLHKETPPRPSPGGDQFFFAIGCYWGPQTVVYSG
jgi:hypothetical protein